MVIVKTTIICNSWYVALWKSTLYHNNLSDVQMGGHIWLVYPFLYLDLSIFK